MNDGMLITAILLIGLVMGYFVNLVINNIRLNIQELKAELDNNRKFKGKQAEVDKMKAAGDFHEWTDIPTNEGIMLVCKKTGWCPTLKGFISMQHINNYLDGLKAEEEYKTFRARRIESIAELYTIPASQVEEIADLLFTMKKEFTLLRIVRLQKELEEKAAAAVVVIDGTKN